MSFDKEININLEDLSCLSKEESIKRKLEIINNSRLIDIPSVLLPDVFTSDYYFVSYSHLDFKKVYSDIFYFQLYDLNIWYDRGIPAGTNWKDVASRYLTPFACKGVIFYISENSLLSDAVINELEYALQANKQIIAINLPIENDYFWDGRNVKGSIFSTSDMVNILVANHKEISEEKIKKLQSIFPEDLIYLSYDMNNATKAEKIKTNIVRESLLRGHFEHNLNTLIIDSINDTSITQIRKSDFYDLINDLKIEISNEFKISFSSCCFANCIYLENVEIPKNASIDTIGDSSFFGDSLFKGFVENNIIHKRIGKAAFKNCRNLKAISISKHIQEIGSMAFMNCSNLREIDTSFFKQFMTMDTVRFKDCPDLTLNEKVFANCTSLSHLDVFPGTVHICDEAFLNCANLKSLKMERRVKTIDDSAFEGCDELKTLGIDPKNPYLLEENNLLFSTENSLKTGIIIAINKNELRRIKLSRTVKHISVEILKNVQEDIEYIVDERNPYFSSYAGSLYNKNYSFLISFSNIQKKTALGPCDFHPNTRTIGSYALANSKINSFESPENLETIKDDAFSNCKNAMLFFFSKDVINFGDNLFPKSNPIVVFTGLPEDSKYVRSINSNGRPVICNYDKKTARVVCDNDALYLINNKHASLIAYLGDDKKYVIPDKVLHCNKAYNVMDVGKSSFAKINNLIEVDFGLNVRKISSYAFDSCFSLRKVVFNEGLLKIEKCAFNKCKNLKLVKFPSTIIEAENGAFNDCTSTKFFDPTKRINLKKILDEFYWND